MTAEPLHPPLRSACTALPALPTTPAAARAFLRQTMRAWHLREGVDTAELVISELVTNAVKAAPHLELPYADLRDVPLVGVELRAADHVLRVAVRDCSAERPVLRAVTEEAENGRGLFLVEALCTRWDVEPEPTGGKVTWAELELPVKGHAW